MSATTIVIGALLTSPAVHAEVDARVFPVRAPQSAKLPFIVVELVSEEEFLRNLSGASAQFSSRVSVAMCGKTFANVDRIAELVKLALGDLRNHPVTDGESPSRLVGTVVESSKAGVDVSDCSADRDVFQRTIDFSVRWK